MLHRRPSGLLCSFLAIICLFSVQTCAVPGYNLTTDHDQIVCVYQLSGQYGLLSRLLFYVVIVFAAVGSSHVWLIAGALTSALIYSGTAVVHAFILAIGTKALYDLDVVGVWAVLSVSCLAIQPMFEWSHVIPKLQSRMIFGFWGSLVAFGTIMAFVTLLRDWPSEPAYRSNDGVRLQSFWGTTDPAFSCSYTCFDKQQILRSPTDMITLSRKRAFGIGCALILITSGNVIMGVIVGLISFARVPQKKTEQELRAIIARNEPRRGDTPNTSIAKAQARNHANAELQAGALPHKTCSSLNLILCLVVLVANEIYLLQDGGLPCNESLYSIGQWAPWVGVALALVAALFRRWKQSAFLERQRILDQERAEFELRRHPRSAEPTSQEQHGVPPSQDA